MIEIETNSGPDIGRRTLKSLSVDKGRDRELERDLKSNFGLLRCPLAASLAQATQYIGCNPVDPLAGIDRSVREDVAGDSHHV